MQDRHFLIIHWHLHWFSGQSYTEQSKWYQLNSVFLCAGLQSRQNTSCIILLYEIFIFTEEAFALKGYFQSLANQHCISVGFQSEYLRQATDYVFCWQNKTKSTLHMHSSGYMKDLPRVTSFPFDLKVLQGYRTASISTTHSFSKPAIG